MGSPEGCCRGKWLCALYVAGAECGTKGETSRLLCVTSSLPSRDYETWKYVPPIQQAAWSHKTFEYGTWGGEIRPEFAAQPGDIVALEHWCSSGFANTDLDLQLKTHGIHQLIVIGLVAHTCVEATVRFAVELGYQVTVVKDATASYSAEHMHAALDINLPNYASAIVSTQEIMTSISAF
jgi:ureidoacrylate peracid hydrolase